MGLKDVEVYSGNPQAAVDQANVGITDRGKQFDAQPIEFTKVDNSTLAIIINYRSKPVSTLLRITATTTPNDWEYKLSGKHPVISFNGVLWFFGVI